MQIALDHFEPGLRALCCEATGVPGPECCMHCGIEASDGSTCSRLHAQCCDLWLAWRHPASFPMALANNDVLFVKTFFVLLKHGLRAVLRVRGGVHDLNTACIG